jgi:putative aldouronate transport system permease protein
MIDNNFSRRIFRFCNTLFFILYALLCVTPIVYVFSMSLSSNTAIAAGRLVLWPVDFTLRSYQHVMQKPEFWSGIRVSFVRVILGVSVNMILIIFAAFPLSKTQREFSGKNFFVVFFIITMLFSGGVVSTYMIVRYTRLLNSIWALILPGALPVFNVILLMNFFKTVPRELEESAFMDGAGYLTILFRIYVPISVAAIATLIVFSMVGHWNSWFDGMIYMSDARKYPLQTYLQSILVTNTARQASRQQAELMRLISDRTVKAAQVFIAMIPALVVYPFLQRYFVTGITAGSVKE